MIVGALIDRRDFLRAAGAAFVAGLSDRALSQTLAADAVYATAFQNRYGGYGVAVLSEAGALLYNAPLPGRGHDVTYDPINCRAVVFSRQPGTFAVIFDPRGAKEPQTISSVAGRHFFGHGAFSPDGALLYATENDFENAAGMVGVYDATDDFRRIGEFATHGVGPHELILMPDGATIAIANGGIETHPDYGRAELNLSIMKPSLVFLNRHDGSLIEKHALPADLHQLSIRHMDVDHRGSIWFGCQYRGPASDRPMLVGKAERGANFGLIEMSDAALGGLRNYVGSVAANHRAGTVAISSPQGNSYAILEAASGKLLQLRSLTEVCGLAPVGESYFATSGLGALERPGADPVTMADHVWDNHLLSFTA